MAAAAPGSRAGGVRRVVGPGDSPSFHGSRGSGGGGGGGGGVHARDVSAAERARIAATSFDDDSYNPLFYNEDEDEDGGGGGRRGRRQAASSDKAATDEDGASGVDDTMQRVSQMHASRRAPRGAVAPDAACVRRTAVALANVHLLDVADTAVRLRIMDNAAWRTANAELLGLYTGARALRGGLTTLVVRQAGAGTYIARRRPVVAPRGVGGGGERFDNPDTLIRWACAGTYYSRHGQRADVHTYTIDDRIDLGVSVATVRIEDAAAADDDDDDSTAAVVVVAFAYWCLRNACSDRLERTASAPPAPGASKSIEAQLWPLPPVRGDVDGGGGGGGAAASAVEAVDLVPGWQVTVQRRLAAGGGGGDGTGMAAARAPLSRTRLYVPVTKGGF